ncbi:hypothetical protein PHYSODRAFT_494816 [Phytophthora sojae]|uniref:Uncharacterized protein n=1 Tax=Phytophthora sojae (strain P6497) TaxID=1094619 RepID=G4Z5S5_PHYSP|nr:hypothetical protein PHYSODRAFT_494816 [Phytophthora sojae]EGZ19508.1 hypothetical protein PHYSODRAFT_494816 [Phytophthora sojae]|eukprot:XP_009522225.1 hypothetical protein PHYSODRAFT_494816 [Phytophthora sojae]
MIGLVGTTKVAPSDGTANANRLTSVTTWIDKWLRAWHGTQLAHFGGKYSIERMLALEEYSRSTSAIRVVLVIISLPLAVFTIVICQETVPLQDPKEGWKANYGFWVRVGFAGVAASYAVTTQVGIWLNVRSLSLRQFIAYSTYSGIAFNAIGITVAAVSVFPVPFFMLTISLVLALFLGVGLRVVLGGKAWRLVCSQRRNLRQFGTRALSRLG